MSVLEIKKLHLQTAEQEIIKGLNLKIVKGELHVIMGPNGSGKSSLSQALIGNPKYQVSQGDILYNGQSILKTPPADRAKAGIFLAWQQPREIEGVRVLTFLKASFEAIQKFRDKNYQPMLMIKFRRKIMELVSRVGLQEEFLNRYINQGFSGGEKKKLETLQLLLLDPQLAILDELDSGLDIDALKKIAQAIKNFKTPAKTILLITHYDKLLKYLQPDFVHIMIDGRIVRSGGRDLVAELEQKGYKSFTKLNGR